MLAVSLGTAREVAEFAPNVGVRCRQSDLTMEPARQCKQKLSFLEGRSVNHTGCGSGSRLAISKAS